MLSALPIMDMAELYRRPIEPLQYLVEGLLTPGLYILGGSPKVGKSWWALQLCLAVCGGKPFLGRQTRQSEVLYLALEDSHRRLRQRAETLDKIAPQGLFLATAAPGIGQGLEAQIGAFLAERPALRLVVIDTLQKVRCPSAAGATYGGDYQDAAALKKLADDFGVCLLVVHHLRKMGDDDPMNRLSGTNGLAGAADGTLILSRENRQEGHATLTATGRDIEDVQEELDFSDCRWHKVTPLEQIQNDLILSALREYLDDNKEFIGTATELSAALEPYNGWMESSRLSKYLRGQEELLESAGIMISTHRSNSRRTIHITKSDIGDRNDTTLEMPLCEKSVTAVTPVTAGRKGA